MLTPEAARLLMVGLQGEGLTFSLARSLKRGEVGGLIFFREDIPTLDVAADLITRARRLSPTPLLIALDEEGGIASQIDGVPAGGETVRSLPSPMSLGDLDDVTLTRRSFLAVSRLLRAAGFDLLFAPLCDVNLERRNPVIGRRSFGSEQVRVARHVLAALNGIRAGGLAACVKHFPGHGASRADSHVELPVIDGELRELPVFRAAIGASVPAIMTAHVHYPQVDADAPATRSRRLLHELLRETLHFPGIVVSDALEMKGFDRGTIEDDVYAALDAGVDLFLVAKSPETAGEVRDALVSVAGRRRERTTVALERLDRFRSRFVGRGAAEEEMAFRASEAATVLDEAHERTLTFRKGRSAGAGEATLLLPSDVPGVYAREAAARCGWSGKTLDVRRWTDGEPVDGWPEGGLLAVTTLRRGPASESERRLREAVARWEAAETGRSVAWLMTGDHDAVDDFPESWTVAGLTSCHESGYRALWRRLMR